MPKKKKTKQAPRRYDYSKLSVITGGAACRVLSPDGELVCAAFSELGAQLIATALTHVEGLSANAELLELMQKGMSIDWLYVNGPDSEPLSRREFLA